MKSINYNNHAQPCICDMYKYKIIPIKKSDCQEPQSSWSWILTKSKRIQKILSAIKSHYCIGRDKKSTLRPLL